MDTITYKKGDNAFIFADVDMTKTGGPLIPAGAEVQVLRVRRGESKGWLWCKVIWEGSDYTGHFSPAQLGVLKN